MDSDRFDALAKSLASSASRRNVLRALVASAGGGLLSLTGLVGARAAADKKTVCHKGKNLSIAASALQAHLDHGDTDGPCCLQTTTCRPDQVLSVSSTDQCKCVCPTGTKECSGVCVDTQ